MFFGKLLPREGNFFELFNEHGTHIAEGARAFMSMVQNYGDPVAARAATPPRSAPPSAPPTRSPPR